MWKIGVEIGRGKSNKSGQLTDFVIRELWPCDPGRKTTVVTSVKMAIAREINRVLHLFRLEKMIIRWGRNCRLL